MLQVLLVNYCGGLGLYSSIFFFNAVSLVLTQSRSIYVFTTISLANHYHNISDKGFIQTDQTVNRYILVMACQSFSVNDGVCYLFEFYASGAFGQLLRWTRPVLKYIFFSTQSLQYLPRAEAFMSLQQYHLQIITIISPTRDSSKQTRLLTDIFL